MIMLILKLRLVLMLKLKLLILMFTINGPHGLCSSELQNQHEHFYQVKVKLGYQPYFKNVRLL